MENFNYTELNIIYNYLQRLNLMLLFNSNNFLENIKSHNINYVIGGSKLLNYIHDKNILKNIQEIIRYNINNNVKINYNNLDNNLKKTLENSLWLNLKGINLNQIIDSSDFNIHIKNKK